MNMNLFYCPDMDSLTLPEEESQHCVQVLRMQTGDHIMLTDGKGTLCEAEIVNPNRKHCTFRVLRSERPGPLHEGHVHIAIAPTKNIDRIEWMLEKCVEMGVDEFTPVLCRYSERKTVNIERLGKILVSAAKQSLKTTFPTLHPLTPIGDFITQATEQDRLFAHCMEGYAPTEAKHALKDCITRGHSVVVLIGPEGDFSPEELQLALEHGWQPVSLGPARLRTETAGLVAAHTAILINE
jgi:16S rRNA (uracil1498-N3)-methyltransferase